MQKVEWRHVINGTFEEQYKKPVPEETLAILEANREVIEAWLRREEIEMLLPEKPDRWISMDFNRLEFKLKNTYRVKQ